MDIVLLPKTADSSATPGNITTTPESAPANAAIPTTTAPAMPVKEAPHDPNAYQSQSDTEYTSEASPTPQTQPKPKHVGQSIAGIITATIAVMIALALLTIVVYLNS